MKCSIARGFTLIELIVAIGLTSIILTALLSFFTAFIGYQVRVQDERVALETVRFLFSELSRELYFGHDYSCGKEVSGVCQCLTFTDQSRSRVKIWYDSTNKQVKRATRLFDPNPSTCSSTDGWVPFTDDAVSITNLSFEIESNAAKQPRVQARIDADYIVDGKTESASFKVQITSRILDPGQSVLSSLIASSENQNASAIHYFAYGPRVNESGQYLDKNGNIVSNAASAEAVCRDGAGNTYTDSFCDSRVIITATEFTNDGLYILGDNGLLFFIPQTPIDDALKATGSVGSNSPVYKTTAALQRAVVRVLGKSGANTCRFCANDPNGIIAIKSAGGYLYAQSHSGTLYRVDQSSATRIMEGGISRNTTRHIDADDNRVLLFFRDATGSRVLRLFSGNFSVSSGDITGGCSEFSYVPNNISGNRCRQLHPDPNTNNGINITPGEIGNTSFRFLEALQVINNTVSLWYQDSTGRNLVSVGQGSSKLKRSDLVASGGLFAYGNGLSKYTSICNNGSSLCIIDSITDNTVTTISTSGTAPLIDHIHFQNLPIGINKDGKLIYFSGASATDTATAITTYNRNGTTNNKQRILCNTTIESDQQVVFKHLSDKHPSKNLAAITGTALIAGYQDEVYLLEPTAANKEQYDGTELNTVCSNTNHVERYNLPTTAGPTGGLDLVRLHGVEFLETKPSTP